MNVNGEEEIPRSREDPPYQAISPNLDRLSRSSVERGSVSRRRILRAVLILGGVLLALAIAVIWSMVLS